MADTLSERLRSSEDVETGPYRIVHESDVLEAAAELDRREAIVAAAEAWAKVERDYEAGKVPLVDRHTVNSALLALLPEAD